MIPKTQFVSTSYTQRDPIPRLLATLLPGMLQVRDLLTVSVPVFASSGRSICYFATYTILFFIKLLEQTSVLL